MNFNYPRTFSSEDDCLHNVLTADDGFDRVAGQSIGRDVENYVFQYNFTRPRECIR